MSTGSCNSLRNVFNVTDGIVTSPMASKSTVSPSLNRCWVCFNTAALAVLLNMPSVSSAGNDLVLHYRVPTEIQKHDSMIFP